MSDLGGFSLHELFRGEAEMHAAALSEGLVRLEGSSDAAVVEPLMRAAHSIKGAARVIGLDIAVRLSHAMEDVLVAMQKGREAISPGRIDQRSCPPRRINLPPRRISLPPRRISFPPRRISLPPRRLPPPRPASRACA